MKKYFSRITADHWTLKNKAEKAARVVAQEMDRRFITDCGKADFIETFKEKIEQVNKNNPRCKPLYFSIWDAPINKGDISFSVSGVFQLSLFLCKASCTTTEIKANKYDRIESSWYDEDSDTMKLIDVLEKVFNEPNE